MIQWRESATEGDGQRLLVEKNRNNAITFLTPARRLSSWACKVQEERARFEDEKEPCAGREALLFKLLFM